MHCSADGNPSPSVQWYKDGQPFTAVTSKSTQDVYVPRSSSSDSALYECIATNYPGNVKEQRKNSIDFQGSYVATYLSHNDIAILCMHMAAWKLADL